MLGIRHGYYTKDADVAWEIDSITEFVANGCIQALYPIIMHQKFGDKEAEAKFLDKWEELGNLLEGRLQKHGKKFIAGTDKITIADFVVSSHYYGLIYNDDSALTGNLKLKVMQTIQSTVNLQRYMEVTMKAELADYLEKRQKFPF